MSFSLLAGLFHGMASYRRLKIELGACLQEGSSQADRSDAWKREKGQGQFP